MASASKTPNLNLPQWVGTEKPERTDFNAANSNIDTAIGSRTYTEQNYVTDGESITASMDAIDTTVASHLAESASKHITESGTNPNGSYIKFDDGTLECSGKKRIPYSHPTAFYNTTLLFPLEFIEKSPDIATSVSSSLTSTLDARMVAHTINSISTSSVRVLVEWQKPREDHTYVDVSYIAKGRWK